MGRDGAHRRPEARRVLGLEVDREEPRCLGGSSPGEFGAEAGVDHRQRDEQREAESQRHDQPIGLRSRSVEVAERQPQQRRARSRQARGGEADHQAEQPQQEDQAGGGGDEGERQAAIRCAPHRKADDCRCQRRQADHCPPRRATGSGEGIAQQRRRRNPPGSGQRRQREGQGDQHGQQRRIRQRRRIERQPGCDGQGITGDGLDQPRHHRAQRQTGGDAASRHRS